MRKLTLALDHRVGKSRSPLAKDSDIEPGNSGKDDKKNVYTFCMYL